MVVLIQSKMFKKFSKSFD